jgi:hypothetical protein
LSTHHRVTNRMWRSGLFSGSDMTSDRYPKVFKPLGVFLENVYNGRLL